MFKKTLRPLTLASLIGTFFFVFLVLTSTGELPPNARSWGSAFAVGVLFGSIFVFDKDFDRKNQDRPVLRIVVSSIAGLCLGLINSFSAEGVIASLLAFGVLGFVGDYWLKHV